MPAVDYTIVSPRGMCLGVGLEWGDCVAGETTKLPRRLEPNQTAVTHTDGERSQQGKLKRKHKKARP